jgi:anti-sigma factor RsiW
MDGFLSGRSACDRARIWASLALDGELSDLERRLLEAHLGRCESCAGFVAGVEALAEVLRAGPLEVPERRFVPPARRRIVPGKRVAGPVGLAASLAGLAVGLGVLVGPLTRESDEPAPRLPEDVVLVTPTAANQLGEQSKLRGEATVTPDERLFPARNVQGNL